MENRLIQETARRPGRTPEEALAERFAGIEMKGRTDAVFLDAAGTRVMGVTGLDIRMPICTELLNQSGFLNYAAGLNGSILISRSDEGWHMTLNGKDGIREADLPEEAAELVSATAARLEASCGTINTRGELVLDLRSQQVGTHYPINLLLGDRTGCDFPLCTTPKSVTDALGRGSFRAAGGDQVLATRYTVNAEENGEPANRQFYIFEGGRQIFYSADVNTNVSEAECCHSQNKTVIRYKTEDGLEITRTIFLLPQEAGCPNAAEAQRIQIRNTSGSERHLRLVATGVFAINEAATLATDVVYANIVVESALLRDGDKVAALTLHAKPVQYEMKKRFAMLLCDGEPMDEFCTSRSEFIGNGTLDHPEHAACLSNVMQRKMASFFAMAKSFTVADGKEAVIDSIAGMCDAEHGIVPDAESAIMCLYKKCLDPDFLGTVLDENEKSWESYASYLIPETEDEEFNVYVSRNLPFQVLYQTYVSRAFAWTQKAYRETGFREIQDIFASMYYLCASRKTDLVRELLGTWVEHVWEMGYANHNFTFKGKEPGDCSDDQLWLLQAVGRYVRLTGDVDFLRKEFTIAGPHNTLRHEVKDTAHPEETPADAVIKKRTLWETIKAILTYSGRISVGKHGLPLLDKADWNDTLRLDNGVMQGPEKEELYYRQLKETGAEYGVPLDNELCESIMNAFLLMIAADETAELAAMIGDKETEDLARGMYEDIREKTRAHAWKGDFYARCLINDGREYTYLGAQGDGLSDDPEIDGCYFLNSYSWSILAGAATEDQIRIMLERVNEYLRTDAGLKLCTLVDFDKLGVATGTALYFPGDRENCGVFKHAAMMASVASVRAAKTVSDPELAADLRELAFFMMDKTLPYKAMEDPFVYRGNPRFYTQYNNSETGENIGPMLSGTASWLTLGVYEYFGLDVHKDKIGFDPLLRPDADSLRYTVNIGDVLLHVSVVSESGSFRTGPDTVYKVNGEEFSGVMDRPLEGEWNVEIIL